MLDRFDVHFLLTMTQTLLGRVLSIAPDRPCLYSHECVSECPNAIRTGTVLSASPAADTIRARRTGRTGCAQKCSGKAVHEFVFVSALTNALDRPLPNGYFVSMRSHDRDTPTRNGSMRVSCRDYNSSSRTGTGTGV